jgi:signal transduction histidine kinase
MTGNRLTRQNLLRFSLCRNRPSGLAPWRTFKLAAFLALAFCLGLMGMRAEAGQYDHLTNSLGSWIWMTPTLDNQRCRFWKSVEVPASSPVSRARLWVTADNEYTLYFDGRELGRKAEWREVCEYDLTLLMSPGKHVVAVDAFNSSRSAGMIFGMRLELLNGQVLEVKSDDTWRIVPDGVRGWQQRSEPQSQWQYARVVGVVGSLPWWRTPENMDWMAPSYPMKLSFWQTGWFQITILSTCFVVILLSIQLMMQLAIRQKERWLLQQERARIARDIHDDLGSRMTQLVLHGEVMQSELPADSETRTQLDRVCQEAREVLANIDEILWAVNPRLDTLSDFASYVCGYAQEYFKRTPIQCFFEIDPDLSAAAFDLPFRRSLLMALKETFNNAVKHSGATELLLRIQCREEKLMVLVQDNGRGFDPNAGDRGRNGLRNMAERMTELEGRCCITSRPGEGCRVEFFIQLNRRQRRPWDWIWHSKKFREPANSGMNDVARIDPNQC